MLWSTGTGSFVGFWHTHLAVCLTDTYANHVVAVATQLHHHRDHKTRPGYSSGNITYCSRYTPLDILAVEVVR
jgi:hypothetical protein